MPVDVLGPPIASRVGPANMSDRRTGSGLLVRLAPRWPIIRTVNADAGYESRKLARQLRRDGWSLQIVKRNREPSRSLVSPGLSNAASPGLASIAVCRKTTSITPAGEVWRESREAENRKAPAQTESAYSAAARCGCGRPFIYRTLTGWLV
ncbi:MAG TPA: transposase, partial [Acetobacteraceae bacterium]|nr:transposase [Acetobacteraceae bacterium]